MHTWQVNKTGQYLKTRQHTTRVHNTYNTIQYNTIQYDNKQRVNISLTNSTQHI